jgi:hypothetical protein
MRAQQQKVFLVMHDCVLETNDGWQCQSQLSIKIFCIVCFLRLLER